MKFETTILKSGNNTGILIPEHVLDTLSAGKRPAVVVTIKGYTYRSTVGAMDGQFLVPLSAEHRKNSGVVGGERLEVTLVIDDQPRVVELPAELAAALSGSSKAMQSFEKYPPSGKKKIALLVESAKTEETKTKRIAKIISDLEEGKKI